MTALVCFRVRGHHGKPSEAFQADHRYQSDRSHGCRLDVAVEVWYLEGILGDNHGRQD